MSVTVEVILDYLSFEEYAEPVAVDLLHIKEDGKLVLAAPLTLDLVDQLEDAAREARRAIDRKSTPAYLQDLEGVRDGV